MKKLVLTLAMAISSILAFATFQKASLVSYNQYFHLPSVAATDSAKVSTPTLELSRMAFYDVDRIVIENNKKQYIKIESVNGKVILESHDSIDIKVEPGTYYVYTTAQHMVGLYK